MTIKSKCCGASVEFIWSLNVYECGKCGKPCDVQDDKPDELVERVAKWLYEIQLPGSKICMPYATFHTWDTLPATPKELRYNEAHSLLSLISKPLSDGSKVVRTDPDQTLPICWEGNRPRAKAFRDLISAGWEKNLPLIEERKGE